MLASASARMNFPHFEILANECKSMTSKCSSSPYSTSLHQSHPTLPRQGIVGFPKEISISPYSVYNTESLF